MPSIEHMAGPGSDRQGIGSRLTAIRDAHAERTPDSCPPDCIDFASNDYLGLAACPAWQDELFAAVAGMRGGRNFFGSGGSRMVSGHQRLLASAEEELAALLGSARSVICSSGYAANVGLLSALEGLGGACLYDQNCHASLRDGIRLSGLKAFPFRHNDLAHLEERLTTGAGRDAFVVVESLYSMDGDFAPVAALAELCRRHGARLIVDEAHAFGWHGARMLGAADDAGIGCDDLFARTLTFGKALGGMGAAIVGGEEVITWLQQKSRAVIYSTAMSPVAAVPALHGIRALAAGRLRERQEALLANVRSFRKHVQGMGMAAGKPFIDSPSPIQGLMVAGNAEVMAAASRLRDGGFFVKGIRSPTVRRGTERIRISLHAGQAPWQVEKLVAAVADGLFQASLGAST